MNKNQKMKLFHVIFCFSIFSFDLLIAIASDQNETSTIQGDETLLNAAVTNFNITTLAPLNSSIYDSQYDSGICQHYSCLCQDGFIYDNDTGICKEIDYCVQYGGHEICYDRNAVCHNRGQGFMCRCRIGFIDEHNTCVRAALSIKGNFTLLLNDTNGLESTNYDTHKNLSEQLEKEILKTIKEDHPDFHFQVQIISLKPAMGTSENETKEVECWYGITVKEDINITLDYLVNSPLYKSCQKNIDDSCIFGSSLKIKSYELLVYSAQYFNFCEKEGVEKFCPTQWGICDNLSLGKGYKCYCKKGLRNVTRSGNFPICIDTDECSDETNKCFKENKICINTFGSFNCSMCKDGFFFKNGACEGICQPNLCQNNASCKALGSHEYECRCSENFKGKHCEILISTDYKLLYIVSGILVALILLAFVIGDKWGVRRMKKELPISSEKLF